MIAFVMALTACGDDAANTPAAPDELATAATTSTAPTTTAPPAPTTTQAPVSDTLDTTEGAWVATAVGDGVNAWFDEPDWDPDADSTDQRVADYLFPAPTQFGGPRVFLALEAYGPFLKVSLPIQPNGSTGWILASDVTLEQITFRAEVDLANYQLTVWNGDEIVVQTQAAIGKPATPTPLGEFYVRDVIPSRSSGAYGSFIIAMSGFSETLETFNGGLPAIAIHGTNRPDLVGQEVSNGCIRIPNEFVELLAATVPLGTPVTVVG